MLPTPLKGELRELAIEVIRQSAKLGASLHPQTLGSLMELFREMNSYYSNLIEGHKTKPRDIQKALNNDFLSDPAKRALQLESVAHIEVQKLIDQRILQEPYLEICNSDFLCWIHKEFYSRLPDTFKEIGDQSSTILMTAGDLRTKAVQVGHHIPPEANTLPSFLKRFFDVYEPNKLDSITQVIASAASHHRLTWIHPFLDGNGRVIRLFSDAYFKKIRIDGHGLWTIARGLARQRSQYMNSLANADSPRRGDLDGRGNLSLLELENFCKFFLTTALDQINFIMTLLDLEGLQKRIDDYIYFLSTTHKIKLQTSNVLKTILLRGEILRGELHQIMNMSERAARDAIIPLFENHLITSSSPKGPLRLGFPISAVEFYFPNLYSE